MKRVNVYDVIREMREQVVKTMQERGITELAMCLSPEEWAKENDCKYEPDEDGYDEQYDDYKRNESPHVIFFDKYGHGIDYRVDKVTLKTGGLCVPVLEFECYNDEWGYNDTFGENDLVFMTLYNVYDTLLDRLSIEDEPEKVWIVKQESNDDGEMHFFTQPCKDEATAKSVMLEWKEALLTKHPKYCDAKPYIDGEKDPDDQACCFEWEDHEASFYIKVLGDDYYENITIKEEKIR